VVASGDRDTEVNGATGQKSSQKKGKEKKKRATAGHIGKIEIENGG